MYKDNVSQHHDEDASINSGNVSLKFLAHLAYVGGYKENSMALILLSVKSGDQLCVSLGYSYRQRNSSLYINFYLLGMYTLK